MPHLEGLILGFERVEGSWKTRGSGSECMLPVLSQFLFFFPSVTLKRILESSLEFRWVIS